MNIDGYILEEYAAGWVLKSPYIGKDKNGNKKQQHKETYHANIEQALFYIRDLCSNSFPHDRVYWGLWGGAGMPKKNSTQLTKSYPR